jgi:parallel beta-helix repeat protein
MTRSRPLKLAALALLVLGLGLGTPVGLAQRTITVCPQGCHYSKIQQAISVASEGDTIQVGAGTYQENLTITKRLTLQGEGKDKVTIQGTVTILSTKLVTLSGFTVKGGQGVYIEDSTTVVLSDNAFVESTVEGLLARSSSITVRGNLISRNKSYGLLLILGSKAFITGNTITSNGGDGINIVASQADIRDNIVRDNGGCGVRADADSTVTGSVTSANFGGNQGGGLCEKALKLDTEPPTITAKLEPRPTAQGWNNSDVRVTFECIDNLSGIASCSSEPKTLTQEGKDQPVTGEAVDNMGNRASTTVKVSIDKTKPIIQAGSPRGTLGNEGWYRSDVTVPFTATDNLSGFDPDGRLSASFEGTTSGEGTDRYVEGRIKDRAGNEADPVSLGPFKVDKTAPTVTAELSPRPNAQGWNNTDVTVSFRCEDRVSGVARCSDPVRVTQEGRQEIRGTGEDRAGNVGSVTVAVNLDKTPPTGSLTINDGAATTISPTVTLRITANDNLSGVAEMRFSNDGRTWSDWESFSSTRSNWDLARYGGSVNQIGPKTVYAQLRDRVGNVSQTFSATIRLIAATLTGHTGSVSSVAFSPDGRLLASGSRWPDTTIKLWDVASGRLVRTLEGHTGNVTSVAFSPDGRLLASGSCGRFALGCVQGEIKLWDVASGRLVRTLSGHTDWVLSVAFSPDGRLLASSGSWDRTIKLWDVATGREVRTLSGHTSGVTSVAFSPDGRLLASGSCGQPLTQFPWCAQGEIRLWDVASGSEVRTLTGHTGSVNSVAFSPDGRLLASGSGDETIKLWDVASGSLVRTLTGHTGSVNSVAFSPDGRLLASGSWDYTIKLWEVATGREVRTLSGHTLTVTSVAFSPDGRLLASGSDDATIKLWDISDLVGR